MLELTRLHSLVPATPLHYSTPPHPTPLLHNSTPPQLGNLVVVTLNPAEVTVGYNVPSHPPPFASSSQDLPADAIILRNHAFSVNYADVTIRCVGYEWSMSEV